MTHWTIMLITILSGPMAGTATPILYRTEALCQAATASVSNSLSESYDHKLACLPTVRASISAHPKERPDANP
jgi:hypothetical protein